MLFKMSYQCRCGREICVRFTALEARSLMSFQAVQWLQLQFDFVLSAIRSPFDSRSTAVGPRYANWTTLHGQPVLGCSVTAASGLRHCDLNDL